MLKEEARELLKGQQWKENTKYYALTLSKVDMPTYNKVCEAFNCLNMGYSADTLNLSKKETERFRNVHVGAYQFQRGQISSYELKIEKDKDQPSEPEDISILP